MPIPYKFILTNLTIFQCKMHKYYLSVKHSVIFTTHKFACWYSQRAFELKIRVSPKSRNLHSDKLVVKYLVLPKIMTISFLIWHQLHLENHYEINISILVSAEWRKILKYNNFMNKTVLFYFVNSVFCSNIFFKYYYQCENGFLNDTVTLTVYLTSLTVYVSRLYQSN